MTIAPLLEAIVAPENSLLTPSVGQDTGRRSHMMPACALHEVTYWTIFGLGFTFSEDSEEPINGMFVAERTKHIQG